MRCIGPSFDDNLNIYDKAYLASRFGEANCFYGERRTVLGTVTYRW